jgi:hypothetical protein
MSQCEVCGNDYDNPHGTPHTYAAPTLTIALTV